MQIRQLLQNCLKEAQRGIAWSEIYDLRQGLQGVIVRERIMLLNVDDSHSVRQFYKLKTILQRLSRVRQSQMQRDFAFEEDFEETTFDVNQINPANIAGLTLTCFLCHQYLCCATETICHHLFCEGCLSEYLLFMDECPQCELRIRDESIFSNRLLDNIINQYIKKHDPSELKSYETRLEGQNRFKRESKVDDFSRGMDLDVRDHNHIWRSAKVIKVTVNFRDEVRSLIIRYNNSRIKEQINAYSIRLAAKGSYTSRKQIPHYYRKQIIIQQSDGTVIQLTEWNTQRDNAIDLEDNMIGNH